MNVSQDTAVEHLETIIVSYLYKNFRLSTNKWYPKYFFSMVSAVARQPL